MDYQYLNKFIDLGVEKAMRHQKFNNDELDWYILLSMIRNGDGSVLVCAERPDRDPVRNRPDPQY